MVFIHRLEEPVEVGHAAEAEAGGIEGVHLRHAHLPEVGRRTHVVFPGFVEQGRHDLGSIGTQLQTVDASFGGKLHPFAGVFRGPDASIFPAGARTMIRDDVRRDDLVARTPFFFVERPIQRPGGHAPDGGDAVGQPELVDVLGLRGFGHAARMHVQVDDAGHDVHAVGVDLFGGIAGPVVRVDLQVGRTDAAYLHDLVAFDDDVHRAAGRCAGAVDHRGASDNQAFKRPLAFVRSAVRSRQHTPGLFLLLFFLLLLRLLLRISGLGEGTCGQQGKHQGCPACKEASTNEWVGGHDILRVLRISRYSIRRGGVKNKVYLLSHGSWVNGY